MNTSLPIPPNGRRCRAALGAAGLLAVLAAPARAQWTALTTIKPDTTQFPAGLLFGDHDLSGDGGLVVFEGQDPLEAFPKGLYTRDLATDTTTRHLGISHKEIQYPAIDRDGDVLAFASGSLELPTAYNGWTQVWVVDGGVIELISATATGNRAAGHSIEPRLSDDGQVVVFSSTAMDLVGGVTGGKYNVFRHDRAGAGATTLISISTTGGGADQNCNDPDVSGDGTQVVFWSPASNLVAGDGNGSNDVSVRDVTAGQTVRVSVGPGGVEANGPSYWPAISEDGPWVVFYSQATNLAG